MSHILAIANQKGGVGKTTTAINLGASLAAAEKRVLVVDADPQCNASSGLGIPRETGPRSLYAALCGETPIGETIHKTELPLLDVVPASRDLAGAEVELVSADDRERRLERALAPLVDKYDYILIDSPPSLGLLTVNTLVAADAILVPMQCEYYALEGLSDLLATVERVKARFNPRLTLEGILFCMYDPRQNLTHQVTEEVKKHFPDAVFSTVIPRNVRLSESPSFGKPILLYDIDSRGSQSYLALAQEVLARAATTRHGARREKVG